MAWFIHGLSFSKAMPKSLWLMLCVFNVFYQQQQAHSNAQDGNPSIIIIGAGMSGIMSAKTLSKHGIEDFLILEATDRVGGRLLQGNFAGYTIELGANWIEGVGGMEKNPIWTLAKEYDLRVTYSDFENVTSNIYSEEGGLLPESVVAPRFDLATASLNYSDALSSSLNAHEEEDISILTAQRLFGQIPTTPLDMAIDFFNYDYETAEPPRITSLKNVLPIATFQEFGPSLYFVADKRGYVHLLHQLAKGFLKYDGENIADPRVKLRKVVTDIEYSPHNVKVKTEDGSTYNATYAIISVSLGVLKSNLINYKPDLPYWKIKTFFQFDMSIFTKIFLKFPYTFWPTGPGTQYFVYADGKRGYYPVWQHLEKEFPGSDILFVAVTDDESRRIEQQSDVETKAEIMEVLKKMFGTGIPDIVDILVPRWWKNRFYGGSYTNWPIGVSEVDFDRMKAPVGPLYFTGEHTSAKFNGYVHGAYLAGIATAETVLDCIKHRKCSEITSDGLPWEHRSGGKQINSTITRNCKGSCCVQVQEEREAMRQAYVYSIDTLEKALAEKCKP